FCYVIIPPRASIEADHGHIGASLIRDVLFGAIGGAPLIFNAVLWAEPLNVTMGLPADARIVRLLAGLGAFLASTVLVQVLAAALAGARSRLVSFEWIRGIGTALSVTGFAVGTWAIVFVTVEFPRSVGTLLLIYTFLAMLLILLTSLEYWLSKLYIPALS